MVVIARPAAEGGHQARMKRGAIEPDRACAAVAGVTSLLDAEDTAVAQECSQALSGLRLGGDELAVNIEVHGRVLIPKFVKPLQHLACDLAATIVGTSNPL